MKAWHGSAWRDIAIETDDQTVGTTITPSVDIAIDTDYKDFQIKLYQAMMNTAANRVSEELVVVHESDQYEELKRKWTDATLQIQGKK